MDLTILCIGMIMLIAAICSVATSSIGIECYNADTSKDLKEKKSSNYGFLVVNLICAITLIFAAFGAMYIGANMP